MDRILRTYVEWMDGGSGGDGDDGSGDTTGHNRLTDNKVLK